jgi:alpha-methylacyl-CoA racemase
MLLADMGAEVLRIDRAGEPPSPDRDALGRGKGAVALDLKTEAGVALCLELVERADVLIEGFRPGVMERLGLGPSVVAARNPRLVYGRMTGWGQEGPLSGSVGHDINYIAVAGALAPLGEADRPPPPPLNLVGDLGGGALYLAFGITAALVERERSGCGQVVDAAIVDGTAHLMSAFRAMRGFTSMAQGEGLLAGAAPFYRCYRCSDGRWLSVGALEPRFYRVLLERTGLDGEALRNQYDQRRWAEAAEALEALFLTRARDQWCALLEGTDACVAPVLDFDEAPGHPHLRARAVFDPTTGAPAPAPRFSRTPGAVVGAEDGWATVRRWKAAAPISRRRPR